MTVYNKLNDILLRAAALLLIVLSSAVAEVHALSADYYASESLLASGRWVKIKVDESGLYSISQAEASSWGFSDVSRLKVFGYGGAPINSLLDSNQIDDLPQIPTYRANGRIIFYAQGPITWSRATIGEMQYVQVQHPYSVAGYYLVTDRDDIEPASISTVETALPAGGSTIDTFTERMFHEVEAFSPGETGTYLLGEDFKYNSSQTFRFSLPRLKAGTEVSVLTSFAAKATGTASSTLTFACNGTVLESTSDDRIGAVSSSDAYTHCKLTTTLKRCKIDGNSLDYTITFKNSGSVLNMARLDYITINYERELAMSGAELAFRCPTGSSGSIMRLGGASASTVVFDVTDSRRPNIVKASVEGSTLRFTPQGSGEREFRAYDGSGSLPTPTKVADVANQNLHGSPTPDLIIVTPSEYAAQARRIASLHESLDAMRVLVVEPELIYNEFSSGTPDVMAYRKLAKMFYDRGADDTGHRLQYMLMFGRGSYDNRMITSAAKSNAYLRLLLWATRAGDYDNSSYATDDMLAALADGSSESNLHDPRLSPSCIGVGRMPVKSAAEAKEVVDKLYSYVTGKDYGPWKNNMIMVADDGDSGIHMRQSDGAHDRMVDNGGSDFVYNRVFLDAYTQVSDGTGNLYPEARKRMFQLLNDGALVLHYIGHANTVSWTHDGLLNNTDINTMYLKHYPLFYTATCEFTRHDADVVSGGEVLFLNNRGGAIALISTIRPTYIANNEIFTNSVARNLFKRDENNLYKRIGDIYRLSKNESVSYDTNGKVTSYTDANKLRYSLIGDPAMRLAYPSYHVALEEINGIAISDDNMPDFKARQTLTLKGSIYDNNGNKATDFNGTIIPTLYDAEKSVETKGNKSSNEDETIEKYVYQERSNKLAIAKDSVRNGEFSVKLHIPSEIDSPDSFYNYSTAMVSFYANSDSGIEANGNNEQFFIYGFDETVELDDEGPEIHQFVLNTESFADGDDVNESPMAIASVSDKSGINLSSSGIGHQMSLLLDGTTLYSDVSTYFTPTINDTESSGGIINYPLENLAQGEHTLRLKVWDSFCNSSERTIAFNVVNGLRPELYDVYTTANPAKTEASFYITHNRPDATVTVRLGVYNLMGQEVWTTTETGKSDMFRTFPITWDLTDMAGRRVPRGIYIYRASISTDGVQESTKSKKLAVAAE